MRQIILLAFALIWAQTIFAQDIQSSESFQMNEIGINFFSVIHNKQFGLFHHSLGNGLIYKKYWHNNALRIGLDLFHYNFKYGIEGDPFYALDSGSSIIGEFRAGYQRNLSITKLQPYLASDVILSFSKSKWIHEGAGDFPPYFYYEERSIRNSEIGIAPTIGLRFRPTNSISFTIESNVALTYYFRKDLKNSVVETEIRCYLNPLRSFSINYHF